MNPRNPLSLWQKFAQGFACDEIAFATDTGLRDDIRVLCAADFSVVTGQDCYPFPSPRSGPERVGPIFSPPPFRRPTAICTKTAVLGFEFAMIPVESPAIKTNQRGSIRCVNLSSFLLCSPFRLPVAWTTRPRAGLAARLRARFWPVQPTTTRLPVRSSAALRARRLAPCLRPSAPAIDLTAASAATAITTASRGTPPAGRFCSAAQVCCTAPARAPLRRA
jgi:hypothetical protein